MASYHFSMKVGPTGKGNPHAQYVCREGRYEGKKSDLEYIEHLNMPSWAAKGTDFWKAADDFERADGSVYREMELALPNELTKEQRVGLVKEFVGAHIGRDYACTIAIHCPKAALKNTDQPHAHIMFSERKLDGIDRAKEIYFKRANKKNPELGGALKDRRWSGKDRASEVERLRESWAEFQNIALKKYGHSVRVDHRSLEVQKQEAMDNGNFKKALELDRPVEAHLGPNIVVRLTKRLKAYLSRELSLEEREKKRAEYYEKVERNKNVKNVFYLREYKRVAETLKNEIDRLPDGSSIKRTATLKDINISLNRLLNERKALMRRVITPERAEIMAIGNYRKQYLKQNTISLISGNLVDYGRAKYRFDTKEQNSFYIKLSNDKGVERVVWGVGLESALKVSNVRIGQKIYLEYQGKEDFVVKTPIRDDLGKVTGWGEKDAHRNEWRVLDAKDMEERFKKILESSEARDKIDRIKEAILERNGPFRKELEGLDGQIDALKAERNEIAVSREMEQGEPPSHVSHAKDDRAINDLKRAANKLSQDSVQGGGIQARILDDEERRRDRDMER